MTKRVRYFLVLYDVRGPELQRQRSRLFRVEA